MREQKDIFNPTLLYICVPFSTMTIVSSLPNKRTKHIELMIIN